MARSVDDIQGLARTVRVFAIVCTVTLFILIAVNHVIPAVVTLVRGGDWSERLSAVGVYAARAAPLVLFAFAARNFRRALDDYSEGRFFEARAARRVSEAGQDVAWAIVAYALIVPNVVLWTVNGGGGMTANLGSETIALFGFALFIVALGRILEQAAALKAENDAIV